MENTSLFLSSKAGVTGRSRRFEQRLTWGPLSLDFFVESLAYSKLDEKLDEVNFPRTSGGSHSIYMPQGWANLVPGDRVDVVVIRLGSKYTNTIFQQPFRYDTKNYPSLCWLVFESEYAIIASQIRTRNQ